MKFILTINRTFETQPAGGGEITILLLLRRDLSLFLVCGKILSSLLIVVIVLITSSTIPCSILALQFPKFLSLSRMLSATRRGFCQSSTRFIRPSIITASSCICLFSTGRYLQSNYQKRNMSAFALPEDLATNPLLQEWSTPFGIPPFNVLQPAHYEPALTFAMKHHLDEVRAIAAAEHAEGATFANIIAPFDRSGTLLYKVCETFENLCSSNGVPELQAVELKMASPLAAHSNAIMTIPGLFAKIDAVYTARHSSGLNDEQIRLVERYHLDFVRAGAKFTPEMQERYGKIVEELAELSTKFTQVRLYPERAFTHLLIGSLCFDRTLWPMKLTSLLSSNLLRIRLVYQRIWSVLLNKLHVNAISLVNIRASSHSLVHLLSHSLLILHVEIYVKRHGNYGQNVAN